MTKNDTFTFTSWGETYKCRFQPGRYGNGNYALRIVDADTGEPIATATTNYENVILHPNYIFIKDWSENRGMLQTLMDLGVVEKHLIADGEPTYHRLTDSGLELFKGI